MKIKRILFVVAMVMAAVNVSAQKGMQGVGINAEVHLNSGVETLYYGGDIKYHYHVSDRGRIEPFFSYCFGEEGSDIAAGLNYHQFFNGIRPNRVYGIVGAGYCSISDFDDYSDESEQRSGILLQVGFGYEHKISHNWSFQTEIVLPANVNAMGDEEEWFFPALKIGFTRNF